jgi:uncharacterized protein YbcI
MTDVNAPPSPASVIARGMVKLLHETSGRGPVQARTTIARDHVLVALQDTLTQGERNLVANGLGDQVMTLRRSYQEIMKADAVKLVEEAIGRKVLGFMSDNHFEPDLAVEVFMLDPREPGAGGEPHEADADG